MKSKPRPRGHLNPDQPPMDNGSSPYLELGVVLDLDTVVIPGDGGFGVGDDCAVEDKGGAVRTLPDRRLG